MHKLGSLVNPDFADWILNSMEKVHSLDVLAKPPRSKYEKQLVFLTH